MAEELKSSAEWQELYPVQIMDPDGWDRQNFDASWAELITHEEFESRVSQSTVNIIGRRNGKIRV